MRLGRSADREPGHVPSTAELFGTIARRTLVGYLVLAVGGSAIAATTAGTSAVWGVLLGVGIAGAAMGLTVVVMMFTEKRPGVNDMAAMLSSYLAKMVILFVVFVGLRGSDFFDRSALLLGFVAAIIISLAVDLWTIARTRA